MYNKFFINFLKVSLNDINQRLDNFLFKKIKYLPRCKIYSLIRKGNIRVNNKRKSYKYKLNLNDILRIPLYNFNIKNKLLYLNKNIKNKFINRIIYEDNYLILVNKPSGISVHDGNKVKLNLIDIYREIKLNKYLNLIHRLDKYSSGLLLISKNRDILINLNNQFKNLNIIKKYYILVCGNWPKNIYKIDKFIFKHKKKAYIINKFTKDYKNIKLKKSLTYFKIIKYINNFTLLKAYPITGRFHQIRLHTSYLGYPILFDNLYGNKNINNKFYINKLSRLFLHCTYISFFHYFLNKKLFFNIKLDNDLYCILNFIKNNNIIK